MWVRSAKNKETGLMTVTCTDWNGSVFFSGEFDNLQDAETAGQNAERRMTIKMTSVAPAQTLDEVLAEIDDDELLATKQAG